MRDEERKAGVRGKARYLYQISLTSLPPLDGGSDGDSLALRSELCPMDDLQNAVTRRFFPDISPRCRRWSYRHPSSSAKFPADSQFSLRAGES